MHPLHRTAIAAALLTLAAAGPAQAAATASAEIGTLTITLIDLDLTDGIAPALIFPGGQSISYAWTTDGASMSDWVAGFYADTAAASFGSRGWASGSTGAGGASADAEVSGSPTVGSQYGVYGNGQFSSEFELTPWTGVILTTSFAGQATTTVGSDGVNVESARANGQISLSIWSDNGYESHYASREAYAGADWDGVQYSGESNSFSGTVKLTYANLSADTVSGGYSANTYASASSALPVPEPGTYGMLIAGLLGMGITLRRQRG